jgi:hypothetical protein
MIETILDDGEVFGALQHAPSLASAASPGARFPRFLQGCGENRTARFEHRY